MWALTAGRFCARRPGQGLTNHARRCRMCPSTVSTFDTTAFNRPLKFIELQLDKFGMSHAFTHAQATRARAAQTGGA